VQNSHDEGRPLHGVIDQQIRISGHAENAITLLQEAWTFSAEFWVISKALYGFAYGFAKASRGRWAVLGYPENCGPKIGSRSRR
jgi:hypothetical protein